MAPIVGPRTPAHLEEYLSALKVELGEQHYQRLAEVSAIQLGAPHEDVASALSHGVDGNRRLLDPPHEPVTTRLHDEHEAIAGLLARVDEALVALVTDPLRGMPSVRAAVDLLTDALLSHLSYEEHELLAPLARFGPELYGH